MKYNKIRITGASGSGKSYLGERLSKLTGLSYSSIDSFAYDFSQTNRFDNKRSFDERNKLLANFLRKKRWILDGGYYSAYKHTYAEADIIIFLRPPYLKRVSITTKRFFSRIKQGKYEGLINFIKLNYDNFTFIKKWDKKRPKIFEKEFGSKLYVFSDADIAYEWFKREFDE